MEKNEVFKKTQSEHKKGLVCGRNMCTFCMRRNKFLGDLYVLKQRSHSAPILTGQEFLKIKIAKMLFFHCAYITWVDDNQIW